MNINHTNLELNQQNRIANVLIADDDSEMARFMLEILARKGIRGTIADSEETAISHINKDDYDLVFTHETIRQRPSQPYHPQGGFRLLNRIKQLAPEIPVVFIT
ncbi:MAG: response regulator, partial [Sedimentisphaerales bacterium]|nr:response regulator [Sedimentisphaerales bacterium]